MKEELKVESEQKALDVLDAIRESKGITQAELGRRAFPDDAAPHMRIRALRVEKNGKKQRLRLGDFRALCVARRRPDPGAYKGVGRLLVKLVLTLF